MKTVSFHPPLPSSRPGGSTSPGGFTLLEMLISLLVVTLLFFLAVPAVQKARQMSLVASNVNNIREVSRGLLGWILDGNNGRFPYAYVNPNAGSYPVGMNMNTLPKNYVYWAGAVFKDGHVGRVESFFSPLQKERYWTESSFSSRLQQDRNAWQWGMIGYGANGVIMPYSSDVRGEPTQTLASLPGAGSTILLADARPNPSQSSNGKYDGFHAVRPKKMTYPLAERVPNRITVSFVDGHAEVMDCDALGWDRMESKWKGDLDDRSPPWSVRP